MDVNEAPSVIRSSDNLRDISSCCRSRLVWFSEITQRFEKLFRIEDAPIDAPVRCNVCNSELVRNRNEP